MCVEVDGERNNHRLKLIMRLHRLFSLAQNVNTVYKKNELFINCIYVFTK